MDVDHEAVLTVRVTLMFYGSSLLLYGERQTLVRAVRADQTGRNQGITPM